MRNDAMRLLQKHLLQSPALQGSNLPQDNSKVCKLAVEMQGRQLVVIYNTSLTQDRSSHLLTRFALAATTKAEAQHM